MGRDRDEHEIGPAEFTRRLPEGGPGDPEGTGPGSSETEEPVQGRDPDVGGPGGPAMGGMGGSGPEGDEVTRHEGEEEEAERGARRPPWKQY
jgi:hypothetical protein